MLQKIKTKVRKRAKKNSEIYNIYKILGEFRAKLNTGTPDDVFLKNKFYENTGEILNIDKPKSYNEKLQWQKIHDRNPLYTKLVDKYEVRKYVEEKIGKEYLVPSYGIYNTFSDIDFNKLPKTFVLKATHDCGSVFICKNKDELDLKVLKKKMDAALKKNYYYYSREWPYKNVTPRIICEKYLENNDGELLDYKIFSFNGKPKLIQVHFDRFSGHKTNNYSLDWRFMDVEFSNYPSDRSKIIPKPAGLKEMIDLAAKLSEGLPQVRVDFYYVQNKIYFGELTFFHVGGMAPIKPKSFNLELGELIDLNMVKR